MKQRTRGYIVRMVSLEEILREALVRSEGNMAELGRAIGISASSVGRWYSGQTKPDFQAALKLAEITGQPARDVLLSAGHDPSVLRVVTNDPAARPSVAVRSRTRSIDQERQRWLEVMGPRMGADQAEAMFWEHVLRDAQRRNQDIEAAITAAQVALSGQHATEEGANKQITSLLLRAL